VTQLRTRAERDGDDYVVNGQRIWTSRALQSDLMLLLARTTPRAWRPLAMACASAQPAGRL
jgi:acyl-CoA dehydrogenase